VGARVLKFRDRAVVVTGAGRGIGRSIALRFAEEGARVALVARTDEELLETARQVEREGGRCVAIPADVRSSAAVEACVERAERELGPTDILVNNAGVFLWRPFLELTPEDWEQVLATNLTGAANFCRAVLPGMMSRRRGRIVNVSSIHGMRGDANLGAHSAAKFGLIGLTQSLAHEFRSYNIAVNAVCPGSVENKIDETGAANRRAPLEEKLWPRDVAKTVLFLASDDAAAITGVALEILGGTHMVIES
jgi:NAD(P)-dependent dehydrogenase (short-subunit alcohol dehydrogenase family)